LPEFHYQELAK